MIVQKPNSSVRSQLFLVASKSDNFNQQAAKLRFRDVPIISIKLAASLDVRRTTVHKY